MRGQGRVFRPTWTEHGHRRTAKTWRLDYSIGGTRYRESANTTSRREALRLLRERLSGREAGKLVGSPEKVTLAALRALVERQYVLDGRRSLGRVQRSLDHLGRVLGPETCAVEITGPRLDAYAERRMAEGVARATVNQELAALRRGFRLAIKKGLLATMPFIELPKVHNERRGFFETGDLAALELELPEPVRAVVRFARLTGWRVHKEILPLTWDAIDWEGQVIRLAQADTKGGEARLFPFGQAPELREVLAAQWRGRRGLFVFHRNGKRITDIRGAWRNACRRAGLVGRIPHDLRRTFARDMRRAGVSEGEIMKLAGWRTRSMFDRYNIIDEQDLAAAVAKRFNGQGAAKSEAAATPPASLSSSAA